MGSDVVSHVAEANGSLRNATDGDWVVALAQARYIASPSLATMVSLAAALGRPLLLEGPAGAGKTSLAYALATVQARELIRLQCFEGMDASHALYDWNYHKQLADLARHDEHQVFDENYLLPRPLMRSLQSRTGAVMLVDEVDRADEAFEALLLEFLGEYQITVPEWRTVQAIHRPIVILTSNRTRPLSDALRRRCLYARLDWPTAAQERDILQVHVSAVGDDVAANFVQAVQRMRTWNLLKPPGVAETIDWAQAFAVTADAVWGEPWLQRTLGCVIKDAIDFETALRRLPELLAPDT